MQRRSSQKTKAKTRTASKATTSRVTASKSASSLATLSAAPTRAVSTHTSRSTVRIATSSANTTRIVETSRPSTSAVSRRTISSVSQKAPTLVAAAPFKSNTASFVAPITTTKRKMSQRNVPGNIFFTTDHEYLKFDSENTAYVGISDYAQESLGELVFVDLPKPGSVIEKGKVFAAVESVKAANDIYAPVSMEIKKVNTALEDQVSLVNEDAQGEGWMLHVHVRDLNEVDGLMDAEAYKEFCNH